jgi:GNAT superfamily N-acetyltransferase
MYHNMTNTMQFKQDPRTLYKIESDNVLFSTDKNKLNLNFVHAFLTNAYWAQGRSLAQVIATIDHSLCYGVYKENKQIGFARVVTDYTVCASLWDVFIDEHHRKSGIGKMLLEVVFNSPVTQAVDRWVLSTRDAHELYKKFGFIQNPSLMASRLVSAVANP